MPQGKLPPEISPETNIIVYHADDQWILYDGMPVKPQEGEQWVVYDDMLITPLGRKKALPIEYCHAEPKYLVGRCRMIKSTGDRCRNAVRAGWNVCHYHGAGRPSNPAGRAPVTGKFSKFLPTRFIEQFEQFLTDPEFLTLGNEMALIDTRIAELLGMLEGADVKMAWAKVRSVAYNLGNIAACQDLKQAQDIAAHEIWEGIRDFVEQRRKLADTERRRMVDAKKYLTLQQANSMMAYIIDVVLKNVNDPLERMKIADQLKTFALRGQQTRPAEIEAPREADVIDAELEDVTIDDDEDDDEI
jgi:hypothetical protein